MSMAKIETGVDRLLDLINKEKRISIEDAAKTLGISKVVIQEWADFLEEEKIISIEYKFSKTFLIERKLNQEEIKEKQKEYSSEKDAFVRKVESSLKNLESQSLGLGQIKEEFESIKKSIGGELQKVGNEVKELEKYEYLKKNLDKDIEKQVVEFHQILDKSHKEIEFEEKRHDSLIEELEVEKREADLKAHRLMGLEEKEQELMKRIESLIEVSKDLERHVRSEQSDISVSTTRVTELEKYVKGIEDNIRKKKEAIQPLLDKAKNHEEQILRLQDDILNKTREKTESIKSKIQEGSKVVANFEKFFAKKAEVETMVNDVEKEKNELAEEFRMLERKAMAFDLATKSNTINTHIKQMEKDLENINKKKSKFSENLEKLIKLVKG